MNARLTTISAAALAIAAVMAGCGSDSDEGSTSQTRADGTSVTQSEDVPAPLGKAEFVARVNAACREEQAGLTKRVAEFERRQSGPPEPGADAVHFVFLPTMEAQVWRIEELGVPRGETGRIDAMLDAERFAVDAVAVTPRVPSVAAAARHFANADRLFRAYGLSSCVSPS
jgi:hypothetical protein